MDHQTHLGIDLAAVAEAGVPAANDGIVLFAGYLGIYGNSGRSSTTASGS